MIWTPLPTATPPFEQSGFVADGPQIEKVAVPVTTTPFTRPKVARSVTDWPIATVPELASVVMGVGPGATAAAESERS